MLQAVSLLDFVGLLTQVISSMAFIAQAAAAKNFNGKRLLGKNEMEQAELLQEVLPTPSALIASGVLE